MFPLSSNQIAAAVGAPVQNVALSWPALEAALDRQSIGTDAVCIAAAATVRVECPPFRPVHEYGSYQYFQKHYEGRADLGNTRPGDGVLFAGRGFIQITGRGNYHRYGQRLGIDLESFPDRALDPQVAANILALYFKDHGIAAAAEAHNWVRVRTLVNGGRNGLAQFLGAESHLEQADAAAASSAPATGNVITMPKPPAALSSSDDVLHLNVVNSLLKLLGLNG